MEIVQSHLRGKDELATDETANFIQDLTKSARWQTERRNTDDAIDKLQEAVRLDDYHYHELLKLLINTEQEPKALNLLNELATQPVKDFSLTQLGAMLLELLERSEPLEYVKTIFRATRHSDMFQVVLQTLQSALTFAQES